jgi:mannosyltransferase OCH1-like enzyme
MIERHIHQIWIQGESNIPEKFDSNIETIKRHNPSWKYTLWDDTSIRRVLSRNKQWIDTYDKFPHVHQKADFGRYVILYLYGGIYIDMDAHTIKPLDGLIEEMSEYGFVISKISLYSCENMFVCGHTTCLNNGVILCQRGNSLMKTIVDDVLTKTCNSRDSKLNCIMKTTGPLMFTDIINQHLDNPTLKIVDASYLEPCVKTHCTITDNTYIKHQHEQSWVDGIMSILSNIYVYVTRTKYVNVMCLAGVIYMFMRFLKLSGNNKT